MTRRADGILAVLCGALLLAGCASGPKGPRGNFGGLLRPIAQPGDVVAVELAFARAAQDKGQWSAFAEFAGDDAVMFVPQPVRAKEWLKGRANPPQAITWQPYQVWSSCDGSLAVTKGASLRPDGTAGYFTTIWQRQEDGAYKWVLDQGDTLEAPLAEPDMVQTDVANCPQRKPGGVQARPQGPGELSGPLEGKSADGSLIWSARVASDNSRELHVSLQKGGTMKEVLSVSVAARSD